MSYWDEAISFFITLNLVVDGERVIMYFAARCWARGKTNCLNGKMLIPRSC